MNFRHLNDIRQSYIEHMRDALTYSFMAGKATICFLIHAIYPDFLVCDGSETIRSLYLLIEDKKRSILERKREINERKDI